MTWDVGDAACTYGISKHVYDTWLGIATNGFYPSPLGADAVAAVKALCYAVAHGIVAELISGGGSSYPIIAPVRANDAHVWRCYDAVGATKFADAVAPATAVDLDINGVLLPASPGLWTDGCACGRLLAGGGDADYAEGTINFTPSGVTHQFTLEAWIRLSPAVGPAAGCLVSLFTDANTYATFDYLSGGPLCASFYWNGTSSQIVLDYKYLQGETHYLVATRNDKLHYFYVDGDLVGANNCDTGAVTFDYLRICKSYANGSPGYGWVGEVRVSDAERSAAEILAQYNLLVPQAL